jgi:cob(I)alamin adenosyltransferase
MAVISKTGDKGVSYWKDKAVAKDDPRMEAMGSLDELQASMELAIPESAYIREIERDLGKIMGEISGYERVGLKGRVEFLENEIIRLEEELPKLEHFILFSSEKAKKINWVRTVTRRVERRMVALFKMGELDGENLVYINRLSDYFFILARKADETGE